MLNNAKQFQTQAFLKSLTPAPLTPPDAKSLRKRTLPLIRSIREFPLRTSDCVKGQNPKFWRSLTWPGSASSIGRTWNCPSSKTHGTVQAAKRARERESREEKRRGGEESKQTTKTSNENALSYRGTSTSEAARLQDQYRHV